MRRWTAWTRPAEDSHADTMTAVTRVTEVSEIMNSHTSLSGVWHTHTSNGKRVNIGSKYGVYWLQWCGIFFIINQHLKRLKMLKNVGCVFFPQNPSIKTHSEFQDTSIQIYLTLEAFILGSLYLVFIHMWNYWTFNILFCCFCLFLFQSLFSKTENEKKSDFKENQRNMKSYKYKYYIICCLVIHNTNEIQCCTIKSLIIMDGT